MNGSIKIKNTFWNNLKTLKTVLINKCKTNIKKTWQVIKEALGKQQVNHQVFREQTALNKKNKTNIESIVIISNNFLTEVGPNLAQTLILSNKHL